MKESTVQSEPVINLESLLSATFSSMEISPTAPVTVAICKLDVEKFFFSLALPSLGLETGPDLAGAYFHDYPYALLLKLTKGN